MDDAEDTARTERLNRLLRSFLDQALSAPSAAIKGFLEIMMEDARDPGFSEFFLDLKRIETANTQLSALIAEVGSIKPIATGHDADQTADYGRLKHDLRTPLNAIKGYSEMWIEDMSEVEGQPFVIDLGHIRECTNQMLARIEQIGHLDRSGPGDGAQPIVVPPVAIAELLQSVAIVQPARGKPSTGRILVVDDEPTNRDLLHRRLVREGHSVSLAENGQVALAKAETEEFDLILLDIIMPGLSGFDVLARLKSQERTRHIPIVVVSALDDIESVVRCIEAGAEDYLPKTFNPTLLRARISASLDKKILRDREEKLLVSILPRPVIARLRNGETTIADRSEEVTILFCDLVGFTPLAARLAPSATVDLLSQLFSAFDRSAARRGVEKIKTIGDAYMAAAGIPEPQPDHAVRVAHLAFDMIADVKELRRDLDVDLMVRIGIHSGAVVAGVIGQSRIAYDVWGDSVNIAARMESHGQVGRVHVSEETRKALKDAFRFEPRGVIDVKGKGSMSTYLLIEPSRLDS